MLWDLLPGRTCLGGAPANFAYITTLMGDQGIVASRVGEDSPGLEALWRMEELGLNIDHVQTDRERPTGSVKVQLDDNGLPRFEIAHPVAWDALEWTTDWQHLVLEISPPVSMDGGVVETFGRCVAALEASILRDPAHWHFWSQSDNLVDLGLLPTTDEVTTAIPLIRSRL